MATKKTKRTGGADKRPLYGITSQLDAEHFRGYTAAELLPALNAAKGGDAAPLGELLCSRIEGAGAKVQDFHIVVHDCDVYTLDDVLINSTIKVGDTKPPHFHAVSKAPCRDDSLTISAIADAVGMAEQAVVLPQRRGRYAHENMLAYMCHSNAPEKHQYAPERVATVRGFDFKTLWEAKHEKWEANGRSTKGKKTAQDYFPLMLDRIRIGKYCTVCDIEADPMMKELYLNLTAKQTSEVTSAFKRAEEMRYASAARLIREHKFVKGVIYISGPNGGDGKTALAMALADALADQYGWNYDVLTDCEHLFDDYHGSEIAIFDELRPHKKITPQVLLTALDNNHASPQGKRYHNIASFAPRVIIITSIYSPYQLWDETLKLCNIDDKAGQFIRRIGKWATVKDAGFVTPYNIEICSPEKFSYEQEITFPKLGDNAERGHFTSNYGFCMDAVTGVEVPLYSPIGALTVFNEHIRTRSAMRDEWPELPMDEQERMLYDALRREYDPAIAAGKLPELLPLSLPGVVDASVADFGHDGTALPGTNPAKQYTPLHCTLGTPVDPGTLDIECEIVEEVEA